MKTKCWIDVFDLSDFQGDRRRFFGPIRLDIATLGLTTQQPFSLRVGDEATLHIALADGKLQTIEPGNAVERLEPGRVRTIEVDC